MKRIFLIFGLFLASSANLSASSSSRTVTIFVDDFSKQNFTDLHASAEEVLNLANQNFLKEGITASYDLVKIKHREIRQHERFDRFWPIVGFLLEEARQELNPANPGNSEVVIFLTGRLRFGTGLALTKDEIFSESALAGEHVQFLAGSQNLAMNGEGVIILGTDTEKEDLDGAKRLALLLMHEQSHLYGLGHVQDENSIMHQRSDLIINGNFNKVKLDLYSKQRLQSILNLMAPR